MPIFYVDEAGFTGEDLMAEDQPIFVQATHNFTDHETQKIIKDIFGDVQATELKHAGLARRPAHQDRIVDFIKFASSDTSRVAIWVAHKEFAAVTMLVEWWMEPLAHKHGFNLYKDGANHAMANMLFVCLGGFWSTQFRRKILTAFQKMVRARTAERFEDFRIILNKAKEDAGGDEKRVEVLRYFIPSFELLGQDHIKELPDHVFDLALPGLIRLAFHWREKSAGPWEVVHDRSSNMAKQKWLWDRFTSTEIQSMIFPNPHGDMIFPVNVIDTKFVDSSIKKEIQLCDVLAGATAAFGKLPNDNPYKKKLFDAGVQNLVVDSIWPGPEVTPDELGRRGWDGNIAIEAIGKAILSQGG